MKPLHVQVAEALGCKVRQDLDYDPTGEWWTCGCLVHGTAHTLQRYDTDWAMTGPLIEKYQMQIEYRSDYGFWRAAGLWRDGARISIESAKGNTPLVAVCNLILTLAAEGKL